MQDTKKIRNMKATMMNSTIVFVSIRNSKAFNYRCANHVYYGFENTETEKHQ